jgi:hypothetical protein
MKTIEEAAIEHFDTITLPGINTGRCVFVNVKKEAYKDAFLEAFIAGVKFARRWISVDEELPDKYVTVIAKVKYNSPAFKDIICLCYRYNNEWYFNNNNNLVSSLKFTHWRYIELKYKTVTGTLFDLPPVMPKADIPPHPGRRCRNCKHIANLNPYSDSYWYCTVTPSNRTSYGVKAVKRMNQACGRFESNS